MITPGLLLRLREVADIGPDDCASFAMLRIGDHDAREILAAVDTMQAVRLYLDAPSPSIDTLRSLLSCSGVETVNLRAGVKP